MINNVYSILPAQQSQTLHKSNLSNEKTTTSFADTLKQAIDQVNQTQVESDKMTEALAAGKDVELHNVMISAEKAGVTMTFAIEIRNKAIETYQEMMRIQV